MKQARINRRERGVAVVESAMTLLGFFVLLFGIMEAGRFLNMEQVLTDAAREGARYAVLPLTQTSTLPGTGAIQNVVQQYLNSADIKNATVTVSQVSIPTGVVTTQYTQVQVTVPYQVLTLSMFSNLQVNLTGKAEMRNETSP